MENSRTRKSLLNLEVTVFTQVANLLIKFINRTIFIRILGVEILGINGLYTNILTLLSMAELGLGNAVIYSMYKPLKNNDTKKISALITFYKKIYTVIIFVILIVGFSFLPFLNYIINVEVPIANFKLYYILFLFDTVVSYIFCYKQSIINADQKVYIIKIINFIVQVLQFIIQIAVLLLFKNYILYLIVQVFCTLLNNVLCSLLANKKYPYIKESVELSKKEKRDIFSNVKSLFMYKISGTILNNTDNIFISILIGTTMVGYYSNYFMVISALNGIIYLVFNSATASIGNLMADDDKDKQNEIFLQLNLLCFILTGICAIELFGIFNDFIKLWIGGEFILSNWVVYITIINLYIYNMQIPVWIYRDTTGLFKDAKSATIVLTAMNIILSYIFGKIFNLFGILFATAISRLLVTTWQQPFILYKKILNTSPKRFFINKIYYILVLAITLIPVYIFSNFFRATTYMLLTIKICGIGIIAIVCFYLMLAKTKECLELKERFINPILNKIKSK